MGIKIVRICDKCNNHFLKFNNPKAKIIGFTVDYICSDCKLVEIINKKNREKMGDIKPLLEHEQLKKEWNHED